MSKKDQLSTIERLPAHNDGWEDGVESDVEAPIYVPPETNEDVVKDR